MSVRLEDDVIRLEGDCPAEDAEALLQLLQNPSSLVVDVAGTGRLHTAVVQVLLAARPDMRGAPKDSFVRDRILPLIHVRPK